MNIKKDITYLNEISYVFFYIIYISILNLSVNSLLKNTNIWQVAVKTVVVQAVTY